MPPGWTATCARILARDPICRLCSARPSAEVHHTRGPGWEADAWLIGVCSRCHRQVTQAQAAAARRLARPLQALRLPHRAHQADPGQAPRQRQESW